MSFENTVVSHMSFLTLAVNPDKNGSLVLTNEN